MILNETYPLANGVQVPKLGLGTWFIDDAEAAEAVREAVKLGYRLIDTAQAYGNEEGVGAAIKASGIPREELYITTKLWNDRHDGDEPFRAIEESLTKLGLDHVDLYLIHWPNPSVNRYVETFQAMIDLRAQGLVTSVGVSNFTEAMLTRLIDETGVTPAVNQVELHPYFPQDALRAFHAAHGIRTESWSPLARRSELLTEQVIADVASAHGVTPTQAVLRWHTQLGSTPIPKSATPARQVENADVFGFTLTDAEVRAISGLERGRLWGGDPDTHEEM